MKKLCALLVLSAVLLCGCRFIESSADYLKSPEGQAQIETTVKKAASGDWMGAIVAGVTVICSTVVGGIAGSKAGGKQAKKAPK